MTKYLRLRACRKRGAGRGGGRLPRARFSPLPGESPARRAGQEAWAHGRLRGVALLPSDCFGALGLFLGLEGFLGVSGLSGRPACGYKHWKRGCRTSSCGLITMTIGCLCCSALINAKGKARRRSPTTTSTIDRTS